MKQKSSRILSLLATIAIAISAMSMTAAAATPMAGVVDPADPLSNMWVAGALVCGILGAILLLLAYVNKGNEQQKTYTYGFISILLGGALLAVAIYVPAETPTVDPDQVIQGNTAYDLILNAANNTGIGSVHSTYYTWGVDVNTTANSLANATNALTTNITISRTGGAITDKITCYVADASIPESDLGYDVIAKTSGIFSITWTDDNGAAVTGLNPLPISYPADSETSAHYVTCSIYLSAAALNDMADNGEDGTQLVLTFESDQIGVIGTVNLNIVLNAFA